MKRRGRKKGHCLSYQFERYMELGDASDEEAPPAPPRNKDLTRNSRMQIVSMIQGMENNGSLPRGLVTAIAKRFGVARYTVHRIWKRADFNSWKKIPGGHLFIRQSLFVKVSRTCRYGNDEHSGNLPHRWECRRPLFSIGLLLLPFVCILTR